MFKVTVYRNTKLISKLRKGLESAIEILIYQNPKLVNSNWLDPGNPEIEPLEGVSSPFQDKIHDKSASRLLGGNGLDLLPESYVRLEKGDNSNLLADLATGVSGVGKENENLETEEARQGG